MQHIVCLEFFNIQMPLLYAEGQEHAKGKAKALKRLEKEIRDQTNDRFLSLNEEQKKILQDSLQFEQIDARHMTIKKAHAKHANGYYKALSIWLGLTRQS